ncbi:DUF3800 domain-containing protein [Kitasatospora misakiensis]|uniref:DUF3800 domain-containing protein n=1 Tax=Kitasatospora misakiensis TaxID=67330 RepID=A0ABW0WY32_9ACTN
MARTARSGDSGASGPGLIAFVDETGDRGFSERSSETFSMTAFLVPRERQNQMRATAAGLRAHIGTSSPLHWVDHFKQKHSARRELAADMLAAIPDVRVVHVVVHKDTAGADEELLRSGETFYNHCCRLILELVAHAAAAWPGGPRRASVKFGHVRHLDHADTVAYLDLVRAGAPQVPWHLLHWPPTWHGTAAYDGLQLADLHCGFLNNALTGAPDDRACASYLISCAAQVPRHAGSGHVLGHGVRLLGDESFLTKRVWWTDLTG